VQKHKNILKSLAAIIHKNKRNAAGNSETIVHPCSTVKNRHSDVVQYLQSPHSELIIPGGVHISYLAF